MNANQIKSKSLTLRFALPLCEHLRTHLASQLDAEFLDENDGRGTVGYITPGWRLAATTDESAGFRTICHPGHAIADLTPHSWLETAIREAVASAPACDCSAP